MISAKIQTDKEEWIYFRKAVKKYDKRSVSGHLGEYIEKYNEQCRQAERINEAMLRDVEKE